MEKDEPKASPPLEGERKRVDKIFADPFLINSICHHIANGGYLHTFAHNLGINVSYLFEFVYGHPERNELYQKAAETREEYWRSKVLAEFEEVAFSKPDKDNPVPASVKVKALETLGKKLKLFTDRVEVSAEKSTLEQLIQGSLNHAKKKSEET